MEKISDIYILTKKLLIENKIQYPAKAAYESFLRFHADHYFRPENCDLSLSEFGYSVIPHCFDNTVHSSLQLNVYEVDGDNRKLIKQSSYLPHQIYLHDIIMKKWKAKSKLEFEIIALRKQPEIVRFS